MNREDTYLLAKEFGLHPDGNLLEFASAIAALEREECAQLIYKNIEMSHAPLVDNECCKNAWMIGWDHGNIDSAEAIRNKEK